MAKDKRGGKRTKGKAMTDSDMQHALDEHFERVNSAIEKFVNAKPGTVNLADIDPELELPDYFEHDTLKSLISNYVKEFNSNLEHFGDGYEYFEDGQVISISYRDGSAILLGVGYDWPGDKKVPTSGIDSVIVDAGWGTAFAGKNVEIYNVRERLPYAADRPGQKYNVYRNVKDRYDDQDDIRIELKDVLRWRK